jgi:hypothetical protein
MHGEKPPGPLPSTGMNASALDSNGAGLALTPLPAGDRADLARLEAVIERGRETFREVAFALLEIRDRRLYRERFPSFRAYCRERWGFHAQNGYRLIQAAEVIREREREGLPPPASVREAGRMRTAARMSAPILPAGRHDVDRPGTPRPPANDPRLLQENIAEARPELAKSAAIGELIDRLRELHAAHPWRARADELLTLYRETVLPWPAGC